MFKSTPSIILFSIIFNTKLMTQQNQSILLPFSKSVIVNDFVFISGQVGIDETTGKLVTSSFEAEANQVMKNIETLLKKEDLSFSDLVNVTIYLKNMDNYQLINKVYSSYFKDKFPARVCIAVAELPAKANIEIAATASANNKQRSNNKEIVRQFLETVRSGKEPENTTKFMADTIYAHQMNAEEQTTVKRIPKNYTEHVKEFLKMYGNYSFEITELITDGDRVYARWIQKGKHLATGKPLTETASCVYRLENGKIVEYWIQIDRLGFEKQLQQNK